MLLRLHEDKAALPSDTFNRTQRMINRPPAKRFQGRKVREATNKP